MFWYLIIGSILLFIIMSFSSNTTTEDFSNNEYVIPQTATPVMSYASPDVDWRDVEDSMNAQYKDEDEDEESKEEEEEEGDEGSEDGEQSEKMARTGETEAKPVKNEKFVSKGQVKENPLYSDQIFILQKQKSAPRSLPKFSNDAFNVYEPKQPPLRYATRPGPNSFNDSLTEVGHVETERERQRDWVAQKNAQWRHQDLLNRLNWVYLEANQHVNPEKILRQPKFIPGPSNEVKYGRYTHYGRA